MQVSVDKICESLKDPLFVMLELVLHVSHVILKHFEFHQAGKCLAKVEDLFGCFVGES